MLGEEGCRLIGPWPDNGDEGQRLRHSCTLQKRLFDEALLAHLANSTSRFQ